MPVQTISALALCASVLGLVVQLANAYLNQKVRADIAALKTEVLDRVDALYVRRDLFDTEVSRLEALICPGLLWKRDDGNPQRAR